MVPTLSRSRAMATKRTLLQHSQLSQHGEFRHVSVSERQRSRSCGQNLRVPFPRAVLPPEVERALEQWRPTARQKRSYLHDQGEFQHQFYTFRSVVDSDHGSVVRIFVGQSQVLEHYIYYLYYITRHNFSPTRSVTLITRHNFSYTRSVIIVSSFVLVFNLFCLCIMT